MVSRLAQLMQVKTHNVPDDESDEMHFHCQGLSEEECPFGDGSESGENSTSEDIFKICTVMRQKSKRHSVLIKCQQKENLRSEC